jgi:1-deoxy-D-xylulose-5-phosphate synthase
MVDHATPDESKASLGLSSPQMAESILKAFFASKDQEPSVVG